MNNRLCFHVVINRLSGFIEYRNGSLQLVPKDADQICPSCVPHIAAAWTDYVRRFNKGLSFISFLLNPSRRKWIQSKCGVTVLSSDVTILAERPCPVSSIRNVDNASELRIVIDVDVTDGDVAYDQFFEVMRQRIDDMDYASKMTFINMRNCLDDISMPDHHLMLMLLGVARPVISMAIRSNEPIMQYSCGRTFTSDPFPEDDYAVWARYMLKTGLEAKKSGSFITDLNSDQCGLNTYYAIQRTTNDSIRYWLPSGILKRYNKEDIMRDMRAIGFRPIASSPDSDDDGIGSDE